MKDEIKEILGGIKVVIKHDGTLEFNAKELKILLDYITNLQEENERLKKRNKEIYDGFLATQEELSDYATRNEKAIEHIKQHQLIFENQYEELSGFDNHLLDILNGGSNE